ncbi:glucose-6-phosphate isomerase [Alkalibacter mobilis]|uniref:glucose-6-phosphate isomerase n=1 Tax=Alkalibacter mobilis TaxID=2787712 RepID=UPI00189DD154|nr:glucose-6-phosphate isomerase [Alkalibacter mobilis]MBF7096501.1 glucose-6-phosphate isomerase [Alkalibacter mobilis]
MSIYVDLTKAMISEDELVNIYPQIVTAEEALSERSGAGKDFLGWYDYPDTYDKEEFEAVMEASKRIRSTCEAFIVIGIGGSYLGSKAVIDALNSFFANEKDLKGPKIYFAGQNISGKYLNDLFELVKDKDVMINVISKSGTTTEPAIAFRVFKNLIESKYGKEESQKRIFVTTDKEKGALKKLSEEEGYQTFVISNDVGGRYSVHTSVGLLPIAVAGHDIKDFMKGAKDQMDEINGDRSMTNPCYRYAAVRNILNRKGKDMEIMVNYEPEMQMFAEWWKQLYGESEGKDGKGIFPVSVNNSTDLHSLGQIIQEGKRNIFETVIVFDQHQNDMVIPYDEADLDGLNYISGKGMNYVNKMAFQGTLLAHVEGNVPNVVINVNELSAYSLGRLVYFFERACGISGYMLGVNPFDQPGVESYKKNMFALLGKRGYEDLAEMLKKNL